MKLTDHNLGSAGRVVYRVPLLKLTAAACLSLATASGCAMHWQDKSGRIHVLGLVCETRQPSTSNPGAVSTESSTNVGLMLYSSLSHRGVSVGYNSESITMSSLASISSDASAATTGGSVLDQSTK